MVASGFQEKHKLLVIITGPTAVGKTAVAIDVARYFNTEIISADSRQFYKGMVIGTAAPSEKELQMVKHHFVGHLNPEENFNVSRYEQSVLKLLERLFTDHEIVVLTGGSGFYIQAVTEGIDELPDADTRLRSELQKIYKSKGLGELQQMLVSYDPDYAAKVDLSNPNRIIRALEVSMQTGVPYSTFLTKSKTRRPFRILKIALNIPRNELHCRINSRVEEMVKSGLEMEAKAFYPLKHLNALNTVGYREFFDYFDRVLSREEAIEKIKTNTRRYARRQITWINRDKEYSWFQPDSQAIIGFIESRLNVAE